MDSDAVQVVFNRIFKGQYGSTPRRQKRLRKRSKP